MPQLVRRDEKRDTLPACWGEPLQGLHARGVQVRSVQLAVNEPIKVCDIPYHFAKACLPDDEAQGIEAVEILGKTEHNEHTSVWWPLNPEDSALLARIWDGLPQPNEISPEDFVWLHITAFENSAERPSWDLRWSPTRAPSINARKSFQDRLEKDIRSGVLVLRDPVTLIPVTISDAYGLGFYVRTSFVVTVADLKEYAKQFEITVEHGDKQTVQQSYSLPLLARLKPRTPQFNGGRIADTDKLTLDEAAKMASKHAGAEVTPSDFLRAAARGEIRLVAVCPRDVTMLPCKTGYESLHIPKDSLPDLPLSACKALSVTGKAAWRTVERFESVEMFGGELGRFTCWQLADDEADLETTPDRCRVLGVDVHALADTFNLADFRTTGPETHKTIIHRKTAVREMKAERKSLNAAPLTHDQKIQWLRDSKVLPDMLISIAREMFRGNLRFLREIELEAERNGRVMQDAWDCLAQSTGVMLAIEDSVLGYGPIVSEIENYLQAVAEMRRITIPHGSIGEQSEPGTLENEWTPQKSDRITPLIGDAQRSLSESATAQQIFLLLEQWAGEEKRRPPLEGVGDENGKPAVLWKDNYGDVQKLTVKKLRDRLGKRRQRATQGDIKRRGAT